jgi:hypothetical protein
MVSTEVEDVQRKAGRPANAARYATPIRLAEKAFADRLPEVADSMLRLALGVRNDSCTLHAVPYQCPEEVETSDWDDDLKALVGRGDWHPCGQKAPGLPANPDAMKYVLNRIMGTPAVAGEKRIKIDFVRKVATHIADVFRDTNQILDPEERAREFARGVAEMWVLVGEQDS